MRRAPQEKRAKVAMECESNRTPFFCLQVWDARERLEAAFHAYAEGCGCLECLLSAAMEASRMQGRIRALVV